MTDFKAYIVPRDARTAVPCLLCGGTSRSVQQHFRHFMICDPTKAKNRARGKVIGATA
jgi:hypothetical protein